MSDDTVHRSDDPGRESERDTQMRQDDTTIRRDEARTNPEVMGRTEPQMHTEHQPYAEHSTENGRLHARFQRLESQFIDDPRKAVDEAERLMEDVFNKMRERLENIHGDIQKNGDTEHLRLAMRGYREMIDSMEHGHAA